MHPQRQYGAWVEIKEDSSTEQSAEAGTPSETTAKAWPEAFISDFGSRQWMTYRSNFTPIPRAKSPEATSSMTLSIRAKPPGEHLRDTIVRERLLSTQCESPKLRIYVTNDTSDVYEDKFTQVARDQTGRIQPTLILLGIRLGIDHITPVYWGGLQAALQYPQSVGVAGGRPSSSHYFVGAQDSHLFFLDPHSTRLATPYRPNELYTPEELDSYYTTRLRRIHIKDMDPSMLIGFLIKDEDDWADWKKQIESTAGRQIVHIFPGHAQPDHGHGRAEALDEVEVLDDSDALE
ncbi:hypothetical protein PENANT_c003G08802 [Penicillium antarcticum]|uniref:Cysteine protease n=1 Tax=Penicillium antarcticum TaxID=416450 RepID=A0A1V6QHE7_9EURO|nr:hypothetical protein PENANT_c003G08802 [Penicillium antarcticum]